MIGALPYTFGFEKHQELAGKCIIEQAELMKFRPGIVETC